MRRYYKYIKPNLFFFIITPILMTIEVLGEIILPRFLEQIINVGVETGDSSYILKTGLKMISFVFFMLIGGVGGSFFSAKASSGFGMLLRNDIFTKVQRFSFANIDKFSTGSLVTRLTNDITQLQDTINMGLKMILRAPGMLIAALIMSIIMSRQLSVVIAVVIPIVVIGIIILVSASFPRFTAMQKKVDKLNSTVQENVTNMRVIKSFVREDVEVQKFNAANTDLRDSSLHAFMLLIAMQPLMTLIIQTTVAVVIWIAGNIILKGDMKVGTLSAFITYIIQILFSLIMTAMIIMQGTRALASAKRINEVLDTDIDLNDDNAKQKDHVVSTGNIEMKNVCFKYYKHHDDYVLDHVNFTAKTGETIGIIGSTGSGKTSLVQLIPRLYDADEGEILVDGVNVKDYSLYNLREGVGMVLQKNVLFSGTIADNLRWGDETADDEKLAKAAESAQAHGFITSFTDGYETVLGQGGVNVSGGQKQRLCIARALLKLPKILILDDSTSAVDTATEARIRKAFKNELKDTTKIIIAQRISSVKDADRIYVIDDGKIVGTGTHKELFNNCEEYREICTSQEVKEA